MLTYLGIAVGSALGGVGRYWCSGLIARSVGETFPWGILFVNVLGSMLIGLFATLTGACITAVTKRYSGVFTNRPELHPLLKRAGRDSGERVWPFPAGKEFLEDLKSETADIAQCTPDGGGDHILAATFLNEFVPPEIPWIHVDLSAAKHKGGLAHVPTEITGFGVRYALHLLLDTEVSEL